MSLVLILPVAPVIDRLRATVPSLKVVSHSADLTGALTTPPPVGPAAYVLQSSKGHPPQFSGVEEDDDYEQKVEAAIQVVLWVNNYAQQGIGTGARADMDRLLNQIGDALSGWSPTGDEYPLWFSAATDEHYAAAWLTSQIVFRSEFHAQR